MFAAIDFICVNPCASVANSLVGGFENVLAWRLHSHRHPDANRTAPRTGKLKRISATDSHRCRDDLDDAGCGLDRLNQSILAIIAVIEFLAR